MKNMVKISGLRKGRFGKTPKFMNSELIVYHCIDFMENLTFDCTLGHKLSKTTSPSSLSLLGSAELRVIQLLSFSSNHYRG